MENENSMVIGIRKFNLCSLIACFGVSALVAIIFIISGNFGKIAIKVLITTGVCACMSIAALCCGAYYGRTRNLWSGLSGMVLAGISAAMVILGVWLEIRSEPYAKATAVLGVFAIAFAHSLALLTVRVRETHAWFQLLSATNIFLLAAVIAAMIFGEVGDAAFFKLLCVLVILVAFETLVIPILGRFSEETWGGKTENLSLSRREDGRYEDRQGLLYEVKEMSRGRSGCDFHQPSAEEGLV